MLSVVIPALNEARSLPDLLADLAELAREVDLDVVVIDGGSTDRTAQCAIETNARVVCSPPGRARQLNAGARATRGEWLLFLHADSRLAASARRALVAALPPERGIGAAVFRFEVSLPRGWKRFMEVGQRLRELAFGLPYGDQGLLVRRRLFDEVGQYPEIPLMEDVAIVRRLRRRTRIHRLAAPLLTSGRRYLQSGIVRTWLLHSVLITLYSAGVSPARLALWRDRASLRAR